MPKPPQSTPPHPSSVHPEDYTNPHCVFYPSATLRTSISPSSVQSSLDYADLLSSSPRFQSHMSMHSGLKPCISFPLCGMMHPGPSVFFVIMRIMLLNAVARLISNKRKFDNITPVFRDQLHWFPICQRINFKIAVSVYATPAMVVVQHTSAMHAFTIMMETSLNRTSQFTPPHTFI